jgi:4'-phosphopantetheinyl transferase
MTAAELAIACAGQVTRDLAWLTPGERAVLAALRVAKRRDDWLLGRWTAKHLVAARLGVAPARIAIIAADDGAPEVWLDGARSGLAVSISHSGALGVAAVRDGLAIGADIELLAPRDPALAADFFTPGERAAVAGHDALVNLVWSAKESALKALRVGLREDARAAEVTGVAWPTETWAPLSVAVRAQRLPGWYRLAGNAVVTVVGPALDRPPRERA